MGAIRTGIVLLLAGVLLTYLLGGYALRGLVRSGLESLGPQLSEKGIVVNTLEYANVGMQSIRAFFVRDVQLDFYLAKPVYDKEAFRAIFSANRVIFKLTDVRNPSFLIEIDDFDLEIRGIDQRSEQTFGVFENAYWRGTAPLQFYSLESSTQLITQRVKTLFRINSIPDPMFFKGDVRLTLDGKNALAHLQTVRKNGKTYLRIDEGSILAAADTFDIDLAPATAALIGRHPAKAAHLIKITRDVERRASRLRGVDPYVRDAFKHILWSHRLTVAFGPDFAEAFTDTHETKPGNTPAERRMDYHNNALGRQYALNGVPESELLRRLKADPKVVLSPE